MRCFAVMGYGTVGSGVVELFYKNRDRIEKNCGAANIKRILDIRDFSASPYKDKFTKDFSDIVSDPEISVVVETMGGLTPAYEFVKACLENGKSVVTSNKELVAEKGAELFAIAKEKGVSFLIEASVGGGIPIIRPLYTCLAANEIFEIDGILNGTTNYILTSMENDSVSFEEALATAQKLGYAEKNPSADVDGIDSCRKICILASLAFGKHIWPKDVMTEGVRGVTLADIRCAASRGMAIKLIARAKKLGSGGLVVTVSPALVEKSNRLASVGDVFNAVLVRGDAVGDVIFYGRGAGSLPTASAVMADVMDCLRGADSSALCWEESDCCQLQDSYTDILPAYVRISGGAAESSAVKAFGKVDFIEVLKNELAFIVPAAPYGETVRKAEAFCAENGYTSKVIRLL